MIKVNIKKYRLKRKSKEYKDLCDYLKLQGYELFDHWVRPWNDYVSKIPEVLEINTEHLFRSQFNTDYGRIHNWHETSIPDTKWAIDNVRGYYIESNEELTKAIGERFACSYCSHYEINPTKFHCTECYGSEYLNDVDRTYIPTPGSTAIKYLN